MLLRVLYLLLLLPVVGVRFLLVLDLLLAEPLAEVLRCRRCSD